MRLRSVPDVQAIPIFGSELRIPADGPERKQALQLIESAYAAEFYRLIDHEGILTANEFADWVIVRLLRVFAQVRSSAA